MRALRESLPHTDVVGVALLSSTGESDVLRACRMSAKTVIIRRVERAVAAGVRNFVCPPNYIWHLRREVIGKGVFVNAAGIRPEWARVENDDQASVMTPREAILAGADRVILERPILEADNPYDATMRVIEEVDQALYEL